MSDDWNDPYIAERATQDSDWNDPYAVPEDRGEISKGLEAGVQQIKGFGYGLTALAGEAAGAPSLTKWAKEGLDEVERNTPPPAIASYKDIKSISDAGKYLAYGISTNLPNMLLSIAGGGVGYGVGSMLAKKGVAGMTESAAKALTAKYVERAAVSGAFTASLGMEAGSIAADQLKETGKVHPTLAMAGAIPAALLDVVPEWYLAKRLGWFGGPGAFKGKGAKDRLVEGAKQFGIQFGIEAPTEAMQSALERASVPGKSITNAEAWDEYINSFILGGMTGGVVGGVGGIFSKSARDKGDSTPTQERLSTDPTAQSIEVAIAQNDPEGTLTAATWGVGRRQPPTRTSPLEGPGEVVTGGAPVPPAPPPVGGLGVGVPISTTEGRVTLGEQPKVTTIEGPGEVRPKPSKTELLADEIWKNNKRVDELSLPQLRVLARDMETRPEIYKGKFDDAQHLYNIVTDRIEKIAPPAAPKPTPIKITHFTRQENVDKILSEGFDTNLPPVHGLGGLAKREAYTAEDKVGKDVLYFTTDSERWSKAEVYVGPGKGERDYNYFNYDTQKWEKEEKALSTINLAPVEAEVKADAKILTIDSMEQYLAFQRDNNVGRGAMPVGMMAEVVAKAKELGYDVLNIKHTAKWTMRDPQGNPRTTKNGNLDWYRDVTGNGGKNDFFVLNKNAIILPKTEKRKGGAYAGLTEDLRSAFNDLYGKEKRTAIPYEEVQGHETAKKHGAGPLVTYLEQRGVTVTDKPIKPGSREWIKQQREAEAAKKAEEKAAKMAAQKEATAKRKALREAARRATRAGKPQSLTTILRKMKMDLSVGYNWKELKQDIGPGIALIHKKGAMTPDNVVEVLKAEYPGMLRADMTGDELVEMGKRGPDGKSGWSKITSDMVAAEEAVLKDEVKWIENKLADLEEAESRTSATTEDEIKKEALDEVKRAAYEADKPLTPEEEAALGDVADDFVGSEVTRGEAEEIDAEERLRSQAEQEEVEREAEAVQDRGQEQAGLPPEGRRPDSGGVVGSGEGTPTAEGKAPEGEQKAPEGVNERLARQYTDGKGIYFHVFKYEDKYYIYRTPDQTLKNRGAKIKRRNEAGNLVRLSFNTEAEALAGMRDLATKEKWKAVGLPETPLTKAAQAAPAPKPAPAPAPAPKPEKPAVKPTENKFFTEDKASKARDLLKKKFGGTSINMGVPLDPEIIQAGIDLAGYHIEKGARTFAAYVKAMVEDLGDGVRPYLKSFYMAVKNYPGFNNEGMDSEKTVNETDVETPKLPKPVTPDARILTARAQFTTLESDEDVKKYVPEKYRKHMTHHQTQGVTKAMKALQRMGGFMFADGTGVGKTRELLAVAAMRAERGEAVLIIAPNEVLGKPFSNKNTITGSYANDAKAMGIEIKLTKGAEPMEAGKIYVSTYYYLDAFFGKKINTIIFDEAHAMKNLLGNTAQAEKGMRLARGANNVVFSTATPADKPTHIPYMERIGIYEGQSMHQQLTNLGLMQKDVKVRLRGGGEKTIQVWVVNPRVGEAEALSRMEELFNRMTENGTMIKREINMQGVDIEVTRIKLPPEAHQVQRDIERGFTMRLGGSDVWDLPGLKKAICLMHMRRQQEPFKIDMIVDMAKREVAEGRQVIIFLSRINHSRAGQNVMVGRDMAGRPIMEYETYAESAGTAKTLLERLNAEGITKITELHGNAENKASKAMADFQSKKANVIIATIESGGTGINLDDTVGDAPRTMIVATAPFTAVQNVQAAGRIWRLSTVPHPTMPTRIKFLFGDTEVDDWNAAIITGKMRMLNATVRGEVGRLDISDMDESVYEESGRPKGLGKVIWDQDQMQARLPGEEVAEPEGRYYDMPSAEAFGPQPESIPKPENHAEILAKVKDKPWEWTVEDLKDLRASERTAKLNQIWGPEGAFESWFEDMEGPDKRRYWVLFDSAADLEIAIKEETWDDADEILKDIQSRLDPQDYYAYETVQKELGKEPTPATPSVSRPQYSRETLQMFARVKGMREVQGTLGGEIDKEFNLVNPETEFGRLPEEKKKESDTEDLFKEEPPGRARLREAYKQIVEHTQQDRQAIEVVEKLRANEPKNGYGVDEVIAALETVSPYAWKFMSKWVNKAGTRISFVAEDLRDKDVAGAAYDKKANRIIFNDWGKMVGNNITDWGNVFHQTLAHESIHAIIWNLKKLSPMAYAEMYGKLKNFAKSVASSAYGAAPPFVRQTFTRIDFDQAYEELVTYGFTNPEFANWLNSIPAEAEFGGRTLWGRLKDIIIKAIGRVTGVDKSKLDELNDIMDQTLFVPLYNIAEFGALRYARDDSRWWEKQQANAELYSKYSEMAEKAGVIYNGYQQGFRNHPGFPLFTDPVTGSTFSLREGMDINEALDEVRKRFEVQMKFEFPWASKLADKYYYKSEMPKEELEDMREVMNIQKLEWWDKYFSLPYTMSKKYPSWRRAFEIFGIIRPEKRGRLLHGFASTAEPFFTMEAKMRKEGKSREDIDDAKSRISRVIITGDALLGPELKELRSLVRGMKDTDPRKKAIADRIDQREQENRYSDEELLAGIKDDQGKTVKLNRDEIAVYASVRRALDNMFDAYTDHMKSQLLRRYRGQKWFSILAQAGGVDLNKDTAADLLESGLNKAALLAAQRIQPDVQRVFRLVERAMPEIKDVEKMAAGEIYAKLTTKLGKELSVFRTALAKHIYGEAPITPAVSQELANMTQDIFAAYLYVRPHLKQIRALRNLYRKQVGYFPRVREQGSQKIMLVKSITDESGQVVGEEKLYSGFFSNEKQGRDHYAEIMKRYAENGVLPDDMNIRYDQAVTTPEFAFQGVNDINMQKVLDDAIEGMKIRDTYYNEKGEKVNIHERIRHLGYMAIAKQFQSRGFGRHMTHRQRGVIKGYEENDLQRVLFNYMTGMSGMMTKQEAAASFMEHMQTVKEPTQFAALAEYGRNMLRNETRADKISSRIRSAMFTWYLGGVIRPALIQVTQNFVTGIPKHAQYLRKNNLGGAGKADKDYLKAMKDLATKNLTSIEKRMQDQLLVEGVTVDQYIREIFGGLGNRWDQRYDRLLRWLATPFSWMEMQNRKAAALTRFRPAYQLALKEGLNPDEAYGKAFDSARKFVYDTHYPMMKANVPILAQGEGMGTAIRTLYTFKSFTHNFALQLIEDRKDWRTWVHQMAYIALFGGLMALPFFKDFFDFIERKFGYSPTKSVRKALKSAGGTTLENFGMGGLPAALGMNMSGSLAMGIPFVGEDTTQTIGGVYEGQLVKMGRAMDAWARGDTMRTAQNLAPEFLRGPLIAAEESKLGRDIFGRPGYATTVRGRPIISSTGEPISMGPGEAAVRSLGFQPTAVAREREMEQTIKRQEVWVNEQKQHAAETYRVDVINKRPEAVRDMVRRVKEINEGIKARGLQGLVSPASVANIVKTSREIRGLKQRRELRYKQEELS